MTEKQKSAIIRHGESLLRIFPLATERDPLALCKRLRRIECKAAQWAVKRCNIGLEEWVSDEQETFALNALDRLLHWRKSGVPVFFNWDPRGYTLKIDDDWMRTQGSGLHRDWGGYGIIAPEIGPEGN